MYFAFQLAFMVPTVLYNINWLLDENDGRVILALFVISTILTLFSYLKVSLSDPGFINSMMFNEAYANNETEVS